MSFEGGGGVMTKRLWFEEWEGGAAGRWKSRPGSWVLGAAGAGWGGLGVVLGELNVAATPSGVGGFLLGDRRYQSLRSFNRPANGCDASGIGEGASGGLRWVEVGEVGTRAGVPRLL